MCLTKQESILLIEGHQIQLERNYLAHTSLEQKPHSQDQLLTRKYIILLCPTKRTRLIRSIVKRIHNNYLPTVFLECQHDLHTLY